MTGEAVVRPHHAMIAGAVHAAVLKAESILWDSKDVDFQAVNGNHSDTVIIHTSEGDYAVLVVPTLTVDQRRADLVDLERLLR